MFRSKKHSHESVDSKWKAALVVAVAALLTMVPSFAHGQGPVLADFDARTGTVTPNSAQLGMVSGLGATASWNQFGTPGSLIKDDGYLATGLSGPDAATVARNWISANKTLFRLYSTDGLKLANDAPLTGSDGYAVLFEQEFGGLRAAEDGKITIGVVGSATSGWKIAYASSSLTGDTTLAAQRQLSAQEAWLKAAADVGRAVAVLNINVRDWTILGVQGFANVQRVRLVALPTQNDGVRPVYETLVLDNQAGHMTAYTHYVDAATSAIWLRKDLVEQSHDPVETFMGSVPLTDGACAPDNGPWVVTASESIGSIVVSRRGDAPGKRRCHPSAPKWQHRGQPGHRNESRGAGV